MCDYSLYEKIKNSIKDLVITKLLDKITSQDKEISKCKNENEQLKFNLLLVLKQNVVEKTKFPLSLQKKQKSRFPFLSPNASRSVMNKKLSLSKMTITQYSSNDTNDNKLETKMENCINTLYKRNKAELTLSPSYARPSIDYERNMKEKKDSASLVNNALTAKNAKTKAEPQRQLKSKSICASSVKNISKIVQYKTNCSVFSTPNKSQFSDSLVLHNKSYLGTSTVVDNIKRDKNNLLIKIQKKIISKVRSLNKKR